MTKANLLLTNLNCMVLYEPHKFDPLYRNWGDICRNETWQNYQVGPCYNIMLIVVVAVVVK